MEVLFFDDPVFREHDAGAGHPERPQRLDAIAAGIAPLRDRLRLRPAAPIDPDELRPAHTQGHIDRVLATRGQSAFFDADTRTSPASVDAALRAAGAVATAAVGVDTHSTAFCAVRPPGHHAERDTAMGFCLFNNVAVAAYRALAAGKRRVLIFDPDVHHGNGTQHIFETDPRVFYISVHQWPFYPGTGAETEIGIGEGKGFTANFPLPAGCGDREFGAIASRGVAAIVEAYEPELILFSAGFDAHELDPLGGMRVSSQGFVDLYAAVVSAAVDGDIPFAFALEGGYSLEALEATVPGLLQMLLADAWARPNAVASPVDGLIDRVLGRLHYRF